MRTRWEGHHRWESIEGSHSESRASHRAAQRLMTTQAWPVPAAWGHPARCVSPRGELWHRFCCSVSAQDGEDGTVAFSRAATSLHALTGATQAPPGAGP